MENIKEQFARLYMELDLTDDQAAMIRKLQRDVDAALSQPPVSGSLPSEIRQAVAAYMWSEGCSCCRSDNHAENGERLAELLGVKKYEDGSGYDWESARKQ